MIPCYSCPPQRRDLTISKVTQCAFVHEVLLGVILILTTIIEGVDYPI